MLSLSKKLRTFAIVMFVYLALPMVSIAQPPDPGDNNPDPDAPIDGGVSLVLAAGAVAGARKLYKNRQESKTENNN